MQLSVPTIARLFLYGTHEGLADAVTSMLRGDVQSHQPWRHAMEGRDFGRHEQAGPGCLTIALGDEGNLMPLIGDEALKRRKLVVKTRPDHAGESIDAPSRADRYFFHARLQIENACVGQWGARRILK